MFLAISTWTYTESISCISSSGNSIHTYIHTYFLPHSTEGFSKKQHTYESS